MQNELHLVTYDEDYNRIEVDRIFNQVENGVGFGEIFDLRASPYNASIFACAHVRNDAAASCLSWFRMKDAALEEILLIEHVESDDTPLQSIQWEDLESQKGKSPSEMIACSSSGVYIWDVANGASAQLK